MSKLHPYLPQDRLRALALGEDLPNRTTGSALFADISGFTPLTEALRNTLGPRQGAEQLARHLDTVYSALIAEIERYGGSVLGFAGDAIACWFNGLVDFGLQNDDLAINQPSAIGNQQSSSRATACAFALQEAMQAFAEIPLPDGTTTALALKVAITTGPARRFVVGDPRSGYVDALAGATVSRTATAEHLAIGGEILLDEATVSALGSSLDIQAWRQDKASGERFVVATGFSGAISPVASQPLQELSPETLQPWILPAVYDWMQAGVTSFHTEFRPCTALFVRFVGLDYDADGAGVQLDAFIRKVQTLTERYDGALLQLTIGDKGSYAYLNFGALTAHEDDPRRAVKFALALREAAEGLAYLEPLQIGITLGVMRVGAYGGETRKTFGALGDEVNLAARLMTTAHAGEVLVSSHVYKATRNNFNFEPRPPLPMKGKAEPLPVFAVTGENRERAVRLQEPKYALPMVGRRDELNLIEEKLDLAVGGKSQVVAIVAEAGLGKSRLVAEVIRNARRKGFVGFGGACQSDGIHTPYLAWKSIWQAFFDIDPDMPERKLTRWLEGEIEDRAPSRINAMPLLNVVLDLNLPENDFTQKLEPKIRLSALQALLEDCLKTQTRDEPTLIVIEDLHWLDALSHDLLEGLAKALANYAVCFVLAYRPPELLRLQVPRLEALPQFTRIELHELTRDEAESAIRAKLAQLYPARGGALPMGLVDALMARAQGNPFYLEELLNYVRDRGLDPTDIENLELPGSLYTLIMSRIDQLSKQEKATLRVASIIGRLFRAKWLTGYYPELGAFPQVKVVLDVLEALDITPQNTPEPELAYLFKHIVTHEVTYESLSFDTRARWHEQLARYLENVDASVETIAFHYGRSENQEKKTEYLRKAGEASQKNYANDAALEYYGMLLSMLKDDKEKTQIHLKRGEVLQLMGKWDETESDFRASLESARNDLALKARVQYALGKLSRLRGDYETALDWLGQARELYTRLEDKIGVAEVLIEIGTVEIRKGDYEKARQILNKGLTMVREAGDKLNTALALDQLGHMPWGQGNYPAAQAFYEESLVLNREIGNKAGIAGSLNNLANLATVQHDYAAARVLYEETMPLWKEMGNKLGLAMCYANQGLVALHQGEYATAQVQFEESLALYREMDKKAEIADLLFSLGYIALGQGDFARARALYEAFFILKHEVGHKDGIARAFNGQGYLAYRQGDFIAARAWYEKSLALGKDTTSKFSLSYTPYSLDGLGLIDLAENKPGAREYLLHSMRLRLEIGQKIPLISSVIFVAGLVLQEGNPHFAAQLLGAVEAALKAINAVIEPGSQFFHESTLAKAKEGLGDVAFQTAWKEGSLWSLEEAVKLVLEENT